MFKANSDAIRPVHGAAAAAAWFPGRMMEGLAMPPLSARALQIAKSREELLGLLHDLPDSDRELSFTDLVENKSAVDDSAAIQPEPNRAAAAAAEVKERRRQRSSSSSSRSSFGSNSDGVLLNFYVPASLTRSLTAPRSSRGSSFRCGSTSQSQSNKRERDHTNFGCWSALWDMRKGKSRRQQVVD